MVPSRNRRVVREQLDIRLAGIGRDERYAVPRRGWVRAIRDALGMSAADLGVRLQVTAQSVLALEASEVHDTARLDTLRRAAEAMDCTLVYALIPRTSLHDIVAAQATQVLDSVGDRVRHSMVLEGQAAPVIDDQRRALIDALIDRPGLWAARV